MNIELTAQDRRDLESVLRQAETLVRLGTRSPEEVNSIDQERIDRIRWLLKNEAPEQTSKTSSQEPTTYIRAFNVGTGQVDLSCRRGPLCSGGIPHELRPIELHRKEDGSVDDSPSYCLVMTDHDGGVYFAQFSQRSLQLALYQCVNEFDHGS